MGVSIKLKKFYKYFDCIERVVVLGQVTALTNSGGSDNLRSDGQSGASVPV
mgnify:CR=1 FL=1